MFIVVVIGIVVDSNNDKSSSRVSQSGTPLGFGGISDFSGFSYVRHSEDFWGYVNVDFGLLKGVRLVEPNRA